MKSVMTKYTFLVYHKEYEPFLEELRKIGLLHVSKKGETTQDDSLLQSLVSRKEKITEALDRMSALVGSESPTKPEIADADSVIEGLGEFDSRRQKIQAEIARIDRDSEMVAPWGAIDWNTIEKIGNAGYAIRFFSLPRVDEEAEERCGLFAVGQNGSQTLYMSVMPSGAALDLPTEQVRLPHVTMDELSAQRKEQEDLISQLDAEEKSYALSNISVLEQASRSAQANIDLEQVKLQTVGQAADKVYMLEGWCPKKEKTALESMLDAQGIWYSSREAIEGDDAPVRFENNRFVRMFEVLTKMYGVPVYNEWDPTPVVAPFFTLFFAICMGDAGYGILLMLFGYGVKIGKIKGGLFDMFKGLGPMIMTLGVATLVVGFFLGTAFGINLAEASFIPDSVKALVTPLQGNVPGTTFSKQMVLAIVIGVLHICIAMTIKTVLYTVRFGFKSNISAWGWLLLILGGIVTGIMLMFNVLSEDVARYVLIGIGAVSALGIYIFNDLKRNPLINIGAGLWETYNMATGLMGDVLSYIRLYALGLAGGMLGGAFNNLGQMVMGDAITWTIVPAILIIVFGHVLNLAMSALGAFVHPLRLTFVEYFKNSGYEGKGEEYKPFATAK